MQKTKEIEFDLGPHTLFVTYTSSESIVHAWLHDHVIDKAKIIGFDTESKPQFIKGSSRHKIATIQIAAPSGYCLVYHIIKDHDANHEALESVLGDSSIKKIGAGIHGDVSYLYSDYSFKLNNTLDISKVVNAYIGMIKDMHHRSLSPFLLLESEQFSIPAQKSIVEFTQELDVLHFEKVGIAGIAQGLKIPFNKSKRISISNWETVPLSKAQLHYAAADSWIVLKAHESLVKQLDDYAFPKHHHSRIMNLLS
jgi:ribonuclease D